MCNFNFTYLFSYGKTPISRDGSKHELSAALIIPTQLIKWSTPYISTVSVLAMRLPWCLILVDLIVKPSSPWHPSSSTTRKRQSSSIGNFQNSHYGQLSTCWLYICSESCLCRLWSSSAVQGLSLICVPMLTLPLSSQYIAVIFVHFFRVRMADGSGLLCPERHMHLPQQLIIWLADAAWTIP